MIVALVSVETVLLVLLVVLVAGLLRSHAELLRRIGPADAPAPAIPAPPRVGRGGEDAHASPLTGATPEGDAVTLSFSGAAAAPTLLAFLTSGCSTCAGFWDTLGEPRLPRGVQTLIVTRGAERERPARLRSLAPAGVPVVMSSQAWEDYSVPGAPYFVLVDGPIRGEGVATTWSALASLVADAIEDAGGLDPAGFAGGHGGGRGGSRRARAVDATLAAAGIEPGDPSLYPGRSPSP
jgi:hypothetical protein